MPPTPEPQRSVENQLALAFDQDGRVPQGAQTQVIDGRLRQVQAALRVSSEETKPDNFAIHTIRMHQANPSKLLPEP